MKLWKMCWYDIKNGCLKNIKLLLFPMVYEIVVLFAMMQKVVSYEKYGMEVEKHLGDILLYNFGGMPKYVLSAEKVFEFPVIWTVFLVLILFATLSYPMTNLQGFGNKVLVKGQNRIKWWLSKCLWNLLCNAIFFGLIIVIILIFCQIKGIPFDMHINTEMQTVLFEPNADTELVKDAFMPFGELVLVFLLSVTICQLQMLLCLWFKPVYSFMIMCMMMLASAYFQSVFLIGNYAMLIRHSWINVDGMDCSIGIPVTCVLIVFTVIAGFMRFKRFDIIQEEN